MRWKETIVNIFVFFLGIILGATLHAFWPHPFTVIIGERSEWFWIMIQALGIVIGFWFLHNPVRLYKHNNSIQIMSDLRKSWGSAEMRKLRIDVCKNFIAQQKQPNDLTPAGTEILDFCEEIALYY